jgi:prolyl-tRNA synthetase
LKASRGIWKEKFGEWFRDVVDKAEILDYTYPVKGCGVWLAYGFKLRHNILNEIRKFLDETGHKEMLFPILIPEDLLAKESTHIRSFEGETYWVTKGGENPLNVKLALRPTSETVIVPMVKHWVRSHADLPRRVYQIGSIFRYETRATRPMIRVREVTTFKEAHTFHSTHEDALRQVQEANEIYMKIFDGLCVPYIVSKRPEWDKFAGAEATYAFDTIFPDGRTLQIGTTHDLGQNFGKAFDFTFETKDGGQEYAWQTSYGISERAIAAVIAIHGDDRGLALPPETAPIQVAVIPIPYRGFEDKVENECEKAEAVLRERGFRVKFDNRHNVTPGSKFYDWEIRGVPIRIEIGPKDIERGEVTLVRRDSLRKLTCEKSSLLEYVQKTLIELQKSLRERAWEWLKANIHQVESLDEAKAIINFKGGVVELPWCGEDGCGLQIEKAVEARVLGSPVNLKVKVYGKCPVCGGQGKYIIRVAKAY